MVEDICSFYRVLLERQVARVNQALSIRFFAHSWISDWNHGNAHFCVAWRAN